MTDLARNVPNRSLFHGDNLSFLRGINSNSIHLIATDPPFNKNRDFHATPDSLASGASFQDRWSWDDDVQQEWVDKITDDFPKLMEAIESARYAHSDGMGAYMCFMAVRLLEMKRILREDGSIYLHCDPTASHYLKAIMDAIFGWRNFRNEIVWRRIRAAKASQHVSKSWGRSSDTILYYVASNKTKISPYRKLSTEEILAKFNKVDTQGRRYYDDSAHIFRPPGLGVRPNLCYRWRGFENPHPSGWTLSKDRLEEEYRKGNFVITPDGKLERRKYQDDYQGMPQDNVWIDIPAASGKERLGYPTQKPLALYERIIKASSNETTLFSIPSADAPRRWSPPRD